MAHANANSDGTTIGDVAANDMTQPSEALPHGATQMTWAARGRVGAGASNGNFRAFIPWGHVYKCADQTGRPTARVEIRRLRGFVLMTGDSQWRQLNPVTSVQGWAYREDYRHDNRVAAPTLKTELGLAARLLPKRNFHFWPQSGRTNLPSGRIRGVTVTVEARLLPGSFDATKPLPCLAMGVGADYWRTSTAQWDGSKNNKDVGIGRFKTVERQWRLYGMTTMSASELRSTPLPMTSGLHEPA